MLVEGTVEVTASGEAGGPARAIRTMQAPTYFGEIGILERIPRTANVTAAETCRCLLIDGERAARRGPVGERLRLDALARPIPAGGDPPVGTLG